MNQHVTENVKLDKFAADLNLEIVYAGRGTVTLSSMSVERPGLALAGFSIISILPAWWCSAFPNTNICAHSRRKSAVKNCGSALARRTSVHYSQPRSSRSERTFGRGEKSELSDFQKSEAYYGSYERSVYPFKPRTCAVYVEPRRTDGSIRRGRFADGK